MAVVRTFGHHVSKVDPFPKHVACLESWKMTAENLPAVNSHTSCCLAKPHSHHLREGWLPLAKASAYRWAGGSPVTAEDATVFTRKFQTVNNVSEYSLPGLNQALVHTQQALIHLSATHQCLAQSYRHQATSFLVLSTMSEGLGGHLRGPIH